MNFCPGSKNSINGKTARYDSGIYLRSFVTQIFLLKPATSVKVSKTSQVRGVTDQFIKYVSINLLEYPGKKIKYLS